MLVFGINSYSNIQNSVMKFSCFKTRWGWMAVMGSDSGLVRMIFPAEDEGSAVNSITQGVIGERQEEEFSGVRNALIDYFSGKPLNFDFPLDLANYTPFQRDVWNAARSIPYGRLHSYGWLAARINNPRAARAVGQALGANPLPIIIPCHRIIRADGSRGGFSGGLHWKQRLISLEKAVFIS